MIFVILGILILVVSFAVALISLIREQKGEQVERANEPPDEQAKSIPQGIAVSDNINQVGNSISTPEPKSADFKFPWDEQPQDRQDALGKEAQENHAQAESKLGGGFSVRDLVKKNKGIFSRIPKKDFDQW